jgi:hypothetical protein
MRFWSVNFFLLNINRTRLPLYAPLRYPRDIRAQPKGNAIIVQDNKSIKIIIHFKQNNNNYTHSVVLYNDNYFQWMWSRGSQVFYFTYSVVLCNASDFQWMWSRGSQVSYFTYSVVLCNDSDFQWMWSRGSQVSYFYHNKIFLIGF